MRPGRTLLLCVLVPALARADMWGADVGALTVLVKNSFDQLTNMSDTIATLKRSYEETRRMAGYVDDARQLSSELQHFSGERFGVAVQQGLDEAFPDLATLRSASPGDGAWAKGSGELQRMLSRCARGLGGFACDELHDALTLRSTREALAVTFGRVPNAGPSVQAADYEAAVAITASDAQLGRNQHARAISKELLQRCETSADPGSCQESAAHVATVLQYDQLTQMSDQLAEANRLQAVRIAQQSETRKREVAEAAQRRALIRGAAKHVSPQPVTVKTEGFEVFP